jgi:hypothetical protein
MLIPLLIQGRGKERGKNMEEQLDSENTFYLLWNELCDAKKIYNEIQIERSTLNTRDTSALNSLNIAQREFDEFVEGLRKDFPNSSAWGRRK